jgi:hypothetical protein
MTSQFEFLRSEWPDVYEAAVKAANAAYPDPRTACFYARRTLELAVSWAFKSDASLRLPYAATDVESRSAMPNIHVRTDATTHLRVRTGSVSDSRVGQRLIRKSGAV